MAFIVDQFKAIADWFTPKSSAKEIITILQHIAEGNFSYKINVSKKDKDEHSQILRGLKLTLSELKKYETKERRRRKQLLEANKQLRELDQRKRDFMELASHQLKTPLASMELGLDLLSRKARRWGGEEKDILEQVHESYVRLGRLVNSLLAAVRIEEKAALKPRLRRINIGQLVDAVTKNFKSKFEAKGVQFVVHDGLLDLTLKTDPEFVIHILENLLDNALQYTDQGRVSLAVEASDSRLDFVVTDTGIGVTLPDQRRVFDKLYRGSNVRARSQHGTGLGLYYTKQLIKKLKGRISLESTEDKGTTFCVSLPRN
jgi:signal transduction histidine kinase